MPADLHALAPVLVYDPEDRPHPVQELWAGESPLVLTFVRHFGCMHCREQVAQLRQIGGELETLGARQAVIGCGSTYFARAFREDVHLDTPLYVDERLQAYAAAGLRRSVLASLGPRTVLDSARALMRGAQLGSQQGDPWQQGGVLLIDPGPGDARGREARIAFEHCSQRPAHHVDRTALLAALRGLPARAARPADEQRDDQEEQRAGRGGGR